MPRDQSLTRSVRIGSVTVGGGRRFALIAGPCVIENDEHPFFMAERIRDITGELGIPYVFKASFDKANRTSVDAYRGPGIDEGLAILSSVRERFGMPVTTDVHEMDQVEPAAEVRGPAADPRVPVSARPT